MLERILKSYESPEKKMLFRENEQIYDGYLARILENYGQKETEDGFFGTLFDAIEGLAGQSAKQFSTLKHLCFELSETLLKSGKVLHRISEVFAKCIKTTQEFYRKIHLNAEAGAGNGGVDKKLQEGLAEWGSQLISERKFVIDNMASFFHFRKHEHLAAAQLVSSKRSVDELYRKKLIELEKKKVRLFESKKIETWKLSLDHLKEDINELFKNYAKIKPYIIPDVSLQGDQASDRTWAFKRLSEQAHYVRVEQLLHKLRLLYQGKF